MNIHCVKSGEVSKRGHRLAAKMATTGGWRIRQEILGPVEDAICALKVADRYRMKGDWAMTLSQIDVAADDLRKVRAIINRELNRA